MTKNGNIFIHRMTHNAYVLRFLEGEPVLLHSNSKRCKFDQSVTYNLLETWHISDEFQKLNGNQVQTLNDNKSANENESAKETISEKTKANQVEKTKTIYLYEVVYSQIGMEEFINQFFTLTSAQKLKIGPDLYHIKDEHNRLRVKVFAPIAVYSKLFIQFFKENGEEDYTESVDISDKNLFIKVVKQLSNSAAILESKNFAKWNLNQHFHSV